jgi:hypothetical protein
LALQPAVIGTITFLLNGCSIFQMFEKSSFSGFSSSSVQHRCYLRETEAVETNQIRLGPETHFRPEH